MFGYVIPYEEKLSDEDREIYRTTYCGLCKALGKNYGFTARFLVNYDMTFLYLLLQNLPQKTQKCFCPIRPVCGKQCMKQSELMDDVATLCMLLSYWKIKDECDDGRGIRKIGAKVLECFYRGKYRKAARRFPNQDTLFQQQLTRLNILQQQNCASIDRTADAFANMLKGCVLPKVADDTKRILEFLLYHLGRYLYLVDALEDLPKDCSRNQYNPLRYRYQPVNGLLNDTDKRELIDTIESSISLTASALELLPMTCYRSVLKNIIYFGLSGVLNGVAAGSFRKRKRSHQ